MFASTVGFGSFSLPNADSCNDSTGPEANDNTCDDELRKLERGCHQDTTEGLDQAGKPYRLTASQDVAEERAGEGSENT